MGEQSSPSSKNCFSSVTAIPPVHSSVAYPSACVHGEKGVKWGKNAKGRKRHVYRRSAYPLQILPGHQQGAGAGAAGCLGQKEGHRPGRHRRLHPPRLAGRAAGQAGRSGGGTLYPEGGRAGRAPVRNHRGDQLHLQEKRQGAQGSLPDSPAPSGGGGDPVPPPGGHWQPPLRREAHPGPGLPGSAGDHPGVLP